MRKMGRAGAGRTGVNNLRGERRRTAESRGEDIIVGRLRRLASVQAPQAILQTMQTNAAIRNRNRGQADDPLGEIMMRKQEYFSAALRRSPRNSLKTSQHPLAAPNFARRRWRAHGPAKPAGP